MCGSLAIFTGVGSAWCGCVLHVVIKDPKLASIVVVVTDTRGTGSSSVLKMKQDEREGNKKNTNHKKAVD